MLELTVDEAIRFFPHEEKLGQALWQLQQVGLGYLRLGQPATTLSGGEAQRLKIARELALGAQEGRPQAVRHGRADDGPASRGHPQARPGVRPAASTPGHTLVLIEHNLDVIKLADWVVDLGPEAGDAGGEIVAIGRPEEVAAVAGSHTGDGCGRCSPTGTWPRDSVAHRTPASPRSPPRRSVAARAHRDPATSVTGVLAGLAPLTSLGARLDFAVCSRPIPQ